ncbi:MAG: histidine kinase [Ilumatobacteraceae bacterium]|nr:histidine kinase [Ilumatobacteraceae bacterium]
MSSGRMWRSGRVHDALIVIATGITTAVFVWNGEIAVTSPAPRPPSWYAIALAGLGALPLLVRRSRPWAAFALSTIALAALAVVDAPVGVAIAPGVALYSVAARRSSLDRPLRLAAAVTVGMAGYLAACAISAGVAPWSELLHTVLLWSASWLAGERARLQREQMDELRRDAVRERALAAAEERMRIARDLHDATGHAINVIAVHAGAARLRLGEDPDRTLQALTTIEDLARRTVAELDHMVTGLRADDDATPASLSALPAVVQQHIEAGHRVEVRIDGERTPLPTAVDHAAYRIVQEGLTNASRHGTGSACVVFEYTPESLEVTITNPTAAKARAAARTGHGLIGIDERVGLLGGNVDARLQDGIFVLRATLPLDGRVAP